MRTLLDEHGHVDYGWVMSGMTVWATAYEYSSDKASLHLHQLPVKGIAAYARHPDTIPTVSGTPAGQDKPGIGFDPNRNARYFVPFKKGTTEPAWSRVVSIRSRDLATTEDEAKEQYNMRIRQYIEWHEDRIATLRASLIDPTEGDGTT